MNSLERKEIRYQRRKEKRNSKNKIIKIENAFCFHKAMMYADKCCKGVGYKKSTQNFKLHLFTNIATTCYNIKNNKYEVGKTYNFKINERGKIRNIDAPHIHDRLVHKILANEVLNIYDRHFIYDNGASVKGKGFHFMIKRIKKILYSWYLKYGNNGYVINIDYSKYFENCDHDVIKNIHKKYIQDDYLIKVIENYLFINKGLSLGVEIAQKEALMIPNKLDHFVNNKYKIVRFMDDSIIFIKDYNDAVNLLNNYIKLANQLNIKINKNKTKIVKINDFSFCKWRYKLVDSGKIICIPFKDTIYRQRRKLRKMCRLNLNEEINITRLCFNSYLEIGNSYKYQKYLTNIK